MSKRFSFAGVYLVGAGPGDPGLITVRGLHLLQLADAVLYDNLASAELLCYAPQAQLIYVGKKRSDHAMTQEEIIALMISLAEQGKCVVRLKGGDPFLFGRGGEEAEALYDRGIPFEVVPGVTASLGIAAYTGIPLTHRDHSSAVTFITGHQMDAVDWKLAAGAPTLVVYMGLQALPEIVSSLLAAGRDPESPAIAVRWGTRPDQASVTGTLRQLPQLVAAAHLLPPATVIIGEVVRLREKLDWFGRLPLAGQRIIVTRAEEGGRELAALLRERGAEPILLPVIELARLQDYTSVDLASYDWVVFTSVPAVRFFLERLKATGQDVRVIRGRLAAIGEKTALALIAANLRPDLQPNEANSEALAAAFASHPLNGKRVLLPRAAEAREVLPTALRDMGATVDVVDTYRNILPEGSASKVQAYLESGRRADWVTFTSGSTVKNFLTLAGAASLEGVRIASLGPATSDVIRRHGLQVTVEAFDASIEALAKAMTK